jgi:hypothetical protein
MLKFNKLDTVMLPVHDSFIVEGLDYMSLQAAMSEAMKEFSGVTVPIKATKLDAADSKTEPDLSKHWEQFEPNYPDADDTVAPQLTHQFVDGYRSYQERVGQAVSQYGEFIF